jgi:phosphomannomutase
MLSIPADNLEFPRICPVCGSEIDLRICKKDGVKTFAVNSVAGVFVKMRKERGNLSGSELLKTSKFGYDLRIDFGEVTGLRAASKDLVTYFAALEEVTHPKIVVFSRDHRNYGGLLQEAFEEYARESSAETSIVYGPLCTTMSPYLAAMLSFKEKKSVLALHGTASHNPSSYNGIKASSGSYTHNIFPDTLGFSKQIDGEKLVENYVRWCTQFSPYEAEVNFDLANGAAAICMPKIASGLYPKAKFFNAKLLPDFGGTRPEPGWFVGWPDFGVAFDGDADRSPFYTKSKMIRFSQFIAGLVKEGIVHEKKIIVDQRTPPHLIEFFESHGVKVVIGMIGNTNQAHLSQKKNALWFEENWHSGGYLVGKNRFHWGEAPFAVAFWLDKLKMPVEKLLKGVPGFEYSEVRFKAVPGFNERVVEAVEKRGFKYSSLPTGGIRIDDAKGHVLFRESNTEIGVAKMFATGVDADTLKKKLAFGRELVAAIKGKPSD